jgi:2,5-diamino-6-(ribosylamino)-4(3H)-pyrimidinone 5'-phosphate reductase
MKRPYVIINCAMSADGKIALPNKKQLRISSKEDIIRMYNLRNECDAVLVGVGTILSDDPKLTVKEKYVKNPNQPIRIILDTNCNTPENALAVNEKAKTLIFIKNKCSKKYGSNIEIIKCKTDKNGLIDLTSMLETLYNKGIKKLMVEGGGTVIWSFLEQELVDDMYVFVGPIIVGGKGTPTLADGLGIINEDKVINLKVVNIDRLGSGILIHYKLIK